MYSMRSAVPAALLLGLLCAACVSAQSNQNSYSNLPTTCKDKFQSINTTFYTDKQACFNAIFTALNTTVKASCPDTTIKTSYVWRCFANNGTNVDLVSRWKSWVGECEVMYVANRAGQAETEDGFQYADNSCFRRFNSLSDWESYLKGSLGDSGSAGALTLAFSSVLASIFLGLMLIL